MKPIGLVINTKYPFLGATPDGSASCTCCGEHLLEIKCPYKYKDMNPSLICESDPNFYLKRDQSGEMYLDTAHQYYYQVQAEKQCGLDTSRYSNLKSRVQVKILLCDVPFAGIIFLWYILPELVTRRLGDVAFTLFATTELSAIPHASILPSIQGASAPPSDLHVPSTESYFFCAEGEHRWMVTCDDVVSL